VTSDAIPPQRSLIRSKLYWVGVLYFAEGFPFGVFFDVLPVYFRQQGVDLRAIGVLSLLGLAWTLKFLWAPAIDHYRHHRVWMAGADLAMGAVLIALASQTGFGPWVWATIAVFTLLSATNDIAIDAYTIELLDQDELGLANGIRNGMYRVGILGAGLMLALSDWLSWPGAFMCGSVALVGIAMVMLAAPRERTIISQATTTLGTELGRILRSPRALAVLVGFALGTLWLVNRVTRWSDALPLFWPVAIGIAAAVWVVGHVNRTPASVDSSTPLTEGPMFGALFALLERPLIGPVLLFVLIFKLGDASMGFMVKPFWFDRGFSATEIGMVSVNIGLGLSIAGGLVGGWYTDRVGIFKALWVLGLWQALSNLGYAGVAQVLPHEAGVILAPWHRALMYCASAAESFTGGLGSAAFLAFLMAIVDKRRSAAEYALLSSVFALSRSVAGWAGGFGAHAMGYAPYFLLTFFLSFPAYLLLPWVRRTLAAVPPRST
jgi:MFS transporter, PAT family, beta-lactamase induction signal transducer AmpG